MSRRLATQAEINEFLAKEAGRRKWFPWILLLSSLAGIATAQILVHFAFQ